MAMSVYMHCDYGSGCNKIYPIFISKCVDEISFIFLSRVHIWSTYPAKFHLASNVILFDVIRGCNGTVRINVISNLGTYLAIIGSSMCAINI